jgi:hypothetical protein
MNIPAPNDTCHTLHWTKKGSNMSVHSTLRFLSEFTVVFTLLQMGPLRSAIPQYADISASEVISQATTSGTDTAESSDPAALATVNQAVITMGGTAAWLSLGAATATVRISRTSLPDHVVIWSDDWSSGRNRYRRDLNGPPGIGSVVGNQRARVQELATGKVRIISPVSDMVVLAVGYPAAALATALRRNDCIFNPDRGKAGIGGTETIGIVQRCLDPQYPERHATLHWTFSTSTHLPLNVRLPVRELLHQSFLSELVEYKSFARNGIVLSPSHIDITRASGAKDSLTITNVVYSASLPDTLFTGK